jgi:cell division protein FtsI (penicillin-binding protein 3)
VGGGRGEETDAERNESRTIRRLFLLALAGSFWALLILGKLFYLQVISYSTYKQAAERQQQRTVTIQALRGQVLDRLGHPFALSVPVDSVCVNPRRTPDPALAAEILARVLDLDRQSLEAKIQAAKRRRAGFLWVKRKVTPEESERVRSLKLEYIEIRPESRRVYPDGALAAHLVGSVDFDQRGNLGLEQSLDKALRGHEGEVRMVQDVRQRGVESLASNAAQQGQNITLSIDSRIQFIAERELGAACELRRATSGSVVIMNPYTGEILALASYPSFDPAKPPETTDEREARFNHPVSVPFEPGSVFKVITLATALETTKLRPESTINCGGGTFNLYGRVIHEAKRGYGYLSMADVLAKSSNIGAIQIGLKVGEKNLLEYVRRFGFGRKTGLPLPAESGGAVRDLKYWGKTSIGSVAMGHEISTTAVQLAQACSVIANGGVLVKPRLVIQRQTPGGKLEKEPMEQPHRILKPETAITMRQMMEGVVLHGTGRGTRLPGYTSGGKTGSAQIFDRATKSYTHYYNGSFVGFAPVTNPAVVIAVTLNGTKEFGGVVAGPVFKTVAIETLRLLDVPRDLPETALPEPPQDPAEENDLAIADFAAPPDDLPDAPRQLVAAAPVPAAAPGAPAVAPPLIPEPATVLAPAPTPPQDVAQALRAPSFQGKTMRAVLEESLAAGVPVDVIGSGVAQAQAPAPGTYLRPGERVRVRFQ